MNSSQLKGVRFFLLISNLVLLLPTLFSSLEHTKFSSQLSTIIVFSLNREEFRYCYRILRILEYKAETEFSFGILNNSYFRRIDYFATILARKESISPIQPRILYCSITADT